jgi:hypothetical protein
MSIVGIISPLSVQAAAGDHCNDSKRRYPAERA